jgi:hypothetical protein
MVVLCIDSVINYDFPAKPELFVHGFMSTAGIDATGACQFFPFLGGGGIAQAHNIPTHQSYLCTL